MGRFTPSGGPSDRLPPIRTANTRFLNKSYVTAWFWAAKRDYEAWGTGGGVPPLSTIGYGPSLPLITRDASDPNNVVYGVSTTVNYDAGRSPVLVEFDRLRNIVGIPLDQFRLSSWWKAQQQQSMAVGSSVASVAASTTTRQRSPSVVGGRLSEVEDVLTENAYLRNLGFIEAGRGTVETGLQTNSVLGTTASANTVRRYEFDGEIPSDIESREQAAIIQESMPGVIVYRTHDGKLAISIPDADTPAAMQSKGTISDARILFYDHPRADDVVSA